MNIYINLAFLENLFLSDDDADRKAYIIRMLSSRRSAVKIITDVDIEAIYDDPDKKDSKILIRQIVQNITNHSSDLSEACQIYNFYESTETKAFFIDFISLLPSPEQFGCLLVSTASLEKADFLFHSEVFSILNTDTDWQRILQTIKHPCNALVMTDNYLFSEHDIYMENLKSICASLMPETLDDNFKFDFTIIGFNPKKDVSPLEISYNMLAKYFKETYSYSVNLTIIRADFHDRFIFTNYHLITSGQGFALFKRNKLAPGKSTTIDCKPITYEGRTSSVEHTRRMMLEKCIAINRSNSPASGRMIGDGRNRLLVSD